jgi:tellurite resistance protein TehA-like permease
VKTEPGNSSVRHTPSRTYLNSVENPRINDHVISYKYGPWKSQPNAKVWLVLISHKWTIWPRSLAQIPVARIVIRNFTSQWLLIPQGTGIIAVILHDLGFQFDGLGVIADAFWGLTTLLLLLSLLLYTLRLILYPKVVTTALATDIAETGGLASISITFTTIIQMIALTLVSSWSPRWGLVAYVLWWINTAMAIAACIGIPYVFVKYEPPGMSALSPATQLPLISALTAAAGGAIICSYGELNNRLQVPVIIVSYLLIGIWASRCPWVLTP